MARAVRLALALVLLSPLSRLLGTPVVSPSAARTEVRRVEVSYSFSGEDVFFVGTAPEGSTRVVAVMEGPPVSEVRLMEKGRVVLFWLGVRQYELGGIPGLYLVNVSCPICNGLAPCRHPGDLDACNRLLAPLDLAAGREELAARARVSGLSGPLRQGEAQRVLDGFWTLQEERGLYRVRTDAIRLNPQRAFYHTFSLPAAAPEGRYRITTSFLSDAEVLGVETSELFVRKTGIVEWLSRMADRRPALYGSLSVVIAVAAGWLAGTLFGRSAH